MRRPLPYLVALVLGVGAAALVACSDKPQNGVPANAASSLKGQLEDVRGTVDSAKCDRLSRELRSVITRIDALPSTVDAQLRQRLSDGYDTLKKQGLRECNENRADEQTTTTETQTSTTPTTTATPTTTTPKTPTATTPPTTTPTKPVPPPPVQPPPPGGEGGGTPPVINP